MLTQQKSWGWVAAVVVVMLAALSVRYSAGPVSYINTGGATSTPSSATTTASGGETGTAVKPSNSGVAGVIADLGNASTFYSYLSSTGALSSISGPGPYTVFVPTNQAFAALPRGSISSLSAAAKKRIVQYHIVSGKMLDIDATSAGTHTALSKDPLNFHVDLVYKQAFANSAYAITEYKARNGIVYIMSAVLIPPQTGASGTGATGTPHP